MYKFMFVVIFISSCSSSIFELNKENKIHNMCSLFNGQIIYGIKGALSPRVLQSIDDSFNYWNYIVDKRVFLNYDLVNDETVDNFRIVVEVVDWRYLPSNYDIHVRQYVNSSGMVKFYNDSNGCINYAYIMVSNLYLKNLQQLETIVRHEIGHIFGFKDTVDFTSLMYYRIEETLQHPIDLNNSEIQAVRCLYNSNCDASKIERTY